MADGKFLVGKPSGGVTTVTVTDGATNTNLVLPESGTVSGVTTAVTDNAIARYDGTTGKLQNSGVRIDDNGNVGIGTSTPIHSISSYKATGWNTGVGTQSGSRFIQLSADSSVGTDIFWDSTSFLRFSTGSASDATGYTEKMRINASGNVGIGITTDNGVDKLQVNGSITSKSSSYKYSDLNNACTVNETTIVNNYCLNIPYNDYGYVSVSVATPYSFCMQTFTPLNAPILFIRTMAGGTWSAWVEK